MNLASMIIFVLVLASPVFAHERTFMYWWQNYDEQVTVRSNDGRHSIKKKELSFEELPPYDTIPAVPPGIDAGIGEARVLHETPRATILLIAPRNRMENRSVLNEEYRRALDECSGDRSWIVALPENSWTEIDLNPYCTMDYGPDQIMIDLYWTEGSGRPFIDIVTSKLDCIPHQLYGWDRKAGRYVLKAQKCSGRAPFESYAGSTLFLKQLF